MTFRALRGYSTEARNNIRVALSLPPLQEPSVARAHALYVGGALATIQSDHEQATSMLTECLAIRHGLGNQQEIAATLSTLSLLHLRQGDAAKARDCSMEALATFRQVGDRVGEAASLLNLGEIAVRRGDDAAARDLFEQCLALSRNIKLELEGECQRNLGELALAEGDLQGAQARFTRSLTVCRDAEDKQNEAIALWCLGKTDAARGEHESARAKFAHALRAFESFQMTWEALDCLEDYANLLQSIDRPDDAVRLLAAAVAIRGRLGIPGSQRGEAERQKTTLAARATLGEAAFDAAWAAGNVWGVDDAIQGALASTRSSVATT